MGDDELLASAFRKILTVDGDGWTYHSYVHVWDDSITVDGTYELSADEVAAIVRVIEGH